MKSYVREHFFDYLFLIGILSFGFLIFRYFSYRPQVQQMVAVLMAALYLIWGVVHHYFDGDLNLKIVVEYTVVAALAATLLLIMVGSSS